MATVSVVIPPFTVPAGARVLGPAAVAGGWTKFQLTIDLANLTSMDLLVELSTDGGVTWNHLMSATGIQPEATAAVFTANWADGLPAGQVRATINNSVAFASLGGTMVLT